MHEDYWFTAWAATTLLGVSFFVADYIGEAASVVGSILFVIAPVFLFVWIWLKLRLEPWVIAKRKE